MLVIIFGMFVFVVVVVSNSVDKVCNFMGFLCYGIML